ncbi:MAG: hypothetical protein Ct9H300mP12_02740 [Acidimicrobiales bacterium]|nr:MAG: hypothetical protein Ct9H300mP12_02740 [Acidimicrobiales bacterium]
MANCCLTTPLPKVLTIAPAVTRPVFLRSHRRGGTDEFMGPMAPPCRGRGPHRLPARSGSRRPSLMGIETHFPTAAGEEDFIRTGSEVGSGYGNARSGTGGMPRVRRAGRRPRRDWDGRAHPGLYSRADRRHRGLREESVMETLVTLARVGLGSRDSGHPDCRPRLCRPQGFGLANRRNQLGCSTGHPGVCCGPHGLDGHPWQRLVDVRLRRERGDAPSWKTIDINVGDLGASGLQDARGLPNRMRCHRPTNGFVRQVMPCRGRVRHAPQCGDNPDLSADELSALQADRQLRKRPLLAPSWRL